MVVVEEGQLKGAFRGFHDRETVFEFYGGGKWRQHGENNGDRLVLIATKTSLDVFWVHDKLLKSGAA